MYDMVFVVTSFKEISKYLPSFFSFAHVGFCNSTTLLMENLWRNKLYFVFIISTPHA